MSNRQPKEKTVKQIQKEIEKLRAEYQKTEFRPCHGDIDLFQKDKDLGLLKDICIGERTGCASVHLVT